jgi:hypothetical protein
LARIRMYANFIPAIRGIWMASHLALSLRAGQPSVQDTPPCLQNVTGPRGWAPAPVPRCWGSAPRRPAWVGSALTTAGSRIGPPGELIRHAAATA